MGVSEIGDLPCYGIFLVKTMIIHWNSGEFPKNNYGYMLNVHLWVYSNNPDVHRIWAFQKTFPFSEFSEDVLKNVHILSTATVYIVISTYM
jgi:hypothetical protein